MAFKDPEKAKAYYRLKNARYYAENKARESERCKAYRAKNREERLRKRREKRKANHEAVLAAERAWAKANKEKINAASRRFAATEKRRKWLAEYNEKNREKLAAQSAARAKRRPDLKLVSQNRRRGICAKATPVWANKDAMAAIYRQSAEVSNKTGIPHEVDHIVPLQNPSVCGLNWEGNLRVITRTQNRSKKNLLIDVAA